MEQWLADGRDLLRRRSGSANNNNNKGMMMHDDDQLQAIAAVSLIPKGVEQEAKGGYSEDLTDGMRGILVKWLTKTSTAATTTKKKQKSTPKQYAECKVNYRYTLEDGSVADDQGPEGPLEVVISAGQVTQGFDELLFRMAKGDELEAWLDPAFAFRENGMRPSRATATGPSATNVGVPADTAVKLYLHLVDFQNPMSSLEKVKKAEEMRAAVSSKLSDALQQHQQPNEEEEEAQHRHHYESAIKGYHEALHAIGTSFNFVPSSSITEEDDDEDNRRDRGVNVKKDDHNANQGISDERAMVKERDSQLRAQLHNNIATCWFHLGNLQKSYTFVQKSLHALERRRNPKALYRLSLIHLKRCEYEESAAVLRSMLELGVGVKGDVERQLQLVTSTEQEQAGKMKDSCRKMFSTSS